MTKQNLFLMAWIGLLFIFSTFPVTAQDSYLRIGSRVDGITINVTGGVGSGDWLLQHSSDGSMWEDLLILDATGEAGDEQDTKILWDILPDPEARMGWFRARYLEREDVFLRRFLVEQARWRSSGYQDYQYVLRQNFGQISWQGNVLVADKDVASFQTIDLQPPFVEAPEVPTIQGLFDRIARAIAANAVTIDVTWHSTYGIPMSCFIDLETLLADEESSWSIDDFTPAQ